MHKTRFISALLLLLGCGLLLLSGCRDADLDPIFFTLENEEEIVDRGLDNEITVSHLVTDGTDYYAAAGTIHKRSTGGGDWTTVAVPANGLCTALAYLSGEGALYAGFANRSTGAGMGLWKKTLPGGDWTQLPDVPAGAQVSMLKEANSLLFVSTLESGVGKLYYYNLAGTFQSAVTLPFSDPQVFVRDIASDGAEYWLAAGSELYSSANLGVGFSLAATGAGQPSGVEFWGVHYSDGSAGNPLAGFYVSVYDVSGADGSIRHYDGAWTASAVVGTTFTEFLSVDTDRLWVGTLGGGYYDLQGTTAAELFASIADRRQPDNTIADLYTGAVLRFAKNGATIFACTSLAGLWVTSNLGEDWSRE